MAVPQLDVVAPGRFRLVGELTFESVPPLLTQEGQLFRDVDKVELDLAAIDRSDSAGVALLVNWKRLAKRLQKSIIFTNTPEQMRVIARVSGVDELLSL